MANNGVCINGKKLKQLRGEKNLSQEQLAESSFHENCYISIATVKRAESSQSVSNRILKNICTFFGITTDELIEPEPESNQVFEELSSLLDKHGDNDDIQNLLKEYIN